MDTLKYTQIATDPAAWLWKSRDLRHSGEILWDHCFDDVAQVLSEAHRQSLEVTPEQWDALEGQLSGAKFMYALSVETALKARIIRDNGDKVTVKVVTGPDGKPVSAELTRVGVPLRQGHNLESLAEVTGAFERTDAALFTQDSDYLALREILRHLEDVIRWNGRYPVPRNSTDHYLKPSSLPGRVLGHYMRDWLDPFLDSYQDSTGTQPRSRLTSA